MEDVIVDDPRPGKRARAKSKATLRPRLLGVQTKFGIAAAVAFAGTIGVVMTFTITTLQHHLENDHYRELGMLAANLRIGVLNLMLQGKPSGLQDLLYAYGKSNPTSHAEILNPNMEIVGSSDPHRRGQLVPVATAVYRGPYITQQRLHDALVTTRVEPLVNRGPCLQCHNFEQDIIGYLTVSLPRASLDNRIAGMRNTMLFSSAATLILLLIAARLALSNLVVLPLRSLAGTMQRASLGDLDARARPEASSFELASLSDSFNGMLDSLVAARRELERSYKERLLQADRLVTVGELASGLAHEIKNPLAGLSGALQVLRAEADDRGTGNEEREVLDEMQHQIQRLDRAVEHLLRFARPHPPRPSIEIVNSVVERTLSLLRKYDSAAGVTMLRQLDSKLEVPIDALQIEQVLLNLCLNALQAMGGSGNLKLTTWDEDGGVCIEVRDTGPGIAPEARDQIFKPFFTTKTAGTGLGLSISKRIIDDHNGRLTLACPEEGGCAFTIHLPRLEDAAQEVTS